MVRPHALNGRRGSLMATISPHQLHCWSIIETKACTASLYTGSVSKLYMRADVENGCGRMAQQRCSRVLPCKRLSTAEAIQGTRGENRYSSSPAVLDGVERIAAMPLQLYLLLTCSPLPILPRQPVHRMAGVQIGSEGFWLLMLRGKWLWCACSPCLTVSNLGPRSSGEGRREAPGPVPCALADRL